MTKDGHVIVQSLNKIYIIPSAFMVSVVDITTAKKQASIEETNSNRVESGAR